MQISKITEPAKPFGRCLGVALVLLAGFMVASGQVNNPKPNQPTPRVSMPQSPPARTRTNVDETFELNITERHYSQENFEASTVVETGDASKVSVQIGVALTSARIDVVLRNIRGVIHFRGTLDRLLQVINDRQGAIQPPSPAPAPENK